MEIISVVSHKGGVGKSTVATNLAGALAQNSKVALLDLDIQKSTLNWLSLRHPNANKIYMYEPDSDVDYLIVDHPAGIKDDDLESMIQLSNKVIVPIKPGAFDVMSTKVFLRLLVEKINESEEEVDICLVPNMTISQTNNTKVLLDFVKNVGLPHVASISETQYYSLLSAYGLTLFDSGSEVAQEQKSEWLPLVNWAKGLNKNS